MGGGSHGNHILGDVYAKRQTLLIDVGEMAARLLRIFVGYIEVDVVGAMEFHLGVYRPGHDVAWGKRQAGIVFLHELLPVDVAKHCPIAAHSLCDEERRTVAGMIKGRGMKLDEFHVFHRPFRAIDHRYAVACGYQWIGSGGVDCPDAPRCHHCDFGEECVGPAGLLIKDVSPVAGDVGGPAGHDLSEMMLRDDLKGEMILIDVNLGIGFHGFHQAGLYLRAGVVGMMQDAEFRVSAFAMKVECAVVFLVEIHSPSYQLFNLRRGIPDNFFHCLLLGKPIARHHCVVDMLFKIIQLKVGDTCHAALCKIRVSLLKGGFANKSHSSRLGGFEGKAHPGDAGPYHEIIISVDHIAVVYILTLFIFILLNQAVGENGGSYQTANLRILFGNPIFFNHIDGIFFNFAN